MSDSEIEKEKKEQEEPEEDKIEVEIKNSEEKPNDKIETEPEAEPEEKTPEKIIEESEAKIIEQEDRYLRLVAEFDNYKKRNARLYDSMVQSARENLIFPLLDVIDNFERALDSTENSDIESLQKGTKLIYQQLHELLEKEGVKPIEAIGQEFNPNLHEAIMQVESDKYPEGVIVGEVTRGYKVNDKVIRFSKVTVSKGAGGNTENKDGEE